MKRWTIIAAAAMLATTTGCGFGGAKEETRELSLPADGVTKFAVRTGSGDVTLEGADGLEAIEATATVRLGSTGSFDEDVEFTLTRDGDGATLTTGFETNGWIPSLLAPRSMDVTVRIPRAMAVTIEDGSGDLVVRNVGGTLVVLDGSGDADIAEIGGATTVTDGSGSLRIERVDGNLVVTDGSGDATVKDVTGSLTITDGSGDIDVDGVGGDLIVTDDGSGDLRSVGVQGRTITE
ncbi:hypothetical protein FE782_30105 [Paenibacillus antri]|uniref:DUF4097 domain-containing protein n=1 Tax=Paenibacillus antri TaxID=2582848 RepID=A0A5R9FX48_9BACL|nr:DUF4097 family beta strand repeat-containing protein [Paenibacillus antri]TLS48567.1 hypothetical protein FE782_30105 [Paenibacillus antri]